QAVKLSLGVGKLLEEVRGVMDGFGPLARKLGDPTRTQLKAGNAPHRGDGPGAALLAQVAARGGVCTLDDALIAARRAGFDAIAACEAALALQDAGALVIQLSPPPLPPEKRKAVAQTRVGQLEDALG